VDGPRRYVSITEAMTIAGVSRRTIFNWLKADRVVYVRTAGVCIRIDRTTLLVNHGDALIRPARSQ
jgi:hypothetical protein